MTEPLTDLGVLDSCAECGTGLNTIDWLWYADIGGAHLTFCQSCGPFEGECNTTAPATATRLTDDRTGETFVRLTRIDGWFDK